jgi:hypothetical protein
MRDFKLGKRAAMLVVFPRGAKIMHVLRAFTAAIIMLGLVSPSHAENGIIGAGGFLCAKLGEMYKRDFTAAEKLTTMYVQGYLSGLNDAQVMDGKASAMKSLDTPIASIMNSIRLACDQRPMDRPGAKADRGSAQRTSILRVKTLDLPAACFSR